MEERPSQYEFNEAQNAVLSELSRAMSLTGSLLIFYTALMLVQMGVQYHQISSNPILSQMPQMMLFMGVGGVVNLAALVGYAAVGVWTCKSGTEFRAVVETHGNDLSHLMEALRNLRSVYSLIYYALLASLVLMALWLVGGSALITALMAAHAHS